LLASDFGRRQLNGDVAIASTPPPCDAVYSQITSSNLVIIVIIIHCHDQQRERVNTGPVAVGRDRCGPGSIPRLSPGAQLNPSFTTTTSTDAAAASVAAVAAAMDVCGDDSR